VPIFSVLIDTVRPEKPPYPDVILPGANFAESEGTYTNCERRIQQLHCAISPPAGKKNWEIISALSTRLGYPMNYPTVSSIYNEVLFLTPPKVADALGQEHNGHSLILADLTLRMVWVGSGSLSPKIMRP